MNNLTIEIEKELATLDPADVLHIQRALREMIHLARKKNSINPPSPQIETQRFEIKARPLVLKPGLSYDNIGELLDQAEGEGWK